MNSLRITFFWRLRNTVSAMAPWITAAGLFIQKEEEPFFLGTLWGLVQLESCWTLRYNLNPFFTRKGVRLVRHCLSLTVYASTKIQHTPVMLLCQRFGTDPSSSLKLCWLTSCWQAQASLRDVSTVTVSAVFELRLHANSWDGLISSALSSVLFLLHIFPFQHEHTWPTGSVKR